MDKGETMDPVEEGKVVLARDLAIIAEIGDRMRLGPEHLEVQELIGAHRRLLEAWVSIGPDPRQLGAEPPDAKDPRSAMVLERIRPGLAFFMREAMQAGPSASAC